MPDRSKRLPTWPTLAARSTISDPATNVRPSAPADTSDTSTCLERRCRHRQTVARHLHMNSVLVCCRFVTDEISVSDSAIAAGMAPIPGRRLFRDAPGSPLMPKLFSDPEAIAEDIIRDVGTNLVVGLPLGLGKANHVINALYARAAADRSINLTFFSALTLEKPKPANLLERRFIGPVIDRLFGGYPDLAYAGALHAGALAAQHQGDRVLLPGRKVAARAVRAAALHFRELYPCLVLSAGARAQRRHPTGGEARGRRRHALQPELQHRHHAGYPARPRARDARRSS